MPVALKGEEVVAPEIEETLPEAKTELPDPAGDLVDAQAVSATQLSQPAVVAQNEPTIAAESTANTNNAGIESISTSNAKPPVSQAEQLAGTTEKQVLPESNSKTEKNPGLKQPEIKIETPADAAVTTEETAPSEEFAKVLEHLAPKASPEQAVLSGNTTLHAARADDVVSNVAAAQTTNQPTAIENNQDRIVTGIQSQISTRGGTMRIRLDPPELGAMQVKVEMRGEMVSATFQTSNDQAAKILTNGLEHLKTALEKQGLSVDRLQVQTTKNDGEQAMNSDSGNQSAGGWQGYQNQQDQQRRQTLNRLWKQAAYGRDPLDMVA